MISKLKYYAVNKINNGRCYVYKKECYVLYIFFMYIKYF